ncbi:MAG TPA: TVP38/TMEM64 family protein [Nitrospirae bacterium]|nr:TVP38/TMEM64 family protein [Nitrospirota bacterium]
MSNFKEESSIQGNDYKRLWLKIIIIISVIAFATFVLYKTGVFTFFLDQKKMQDFINSLGPAGFIGFIFLQSLQVVAAPIPGEATGLLGGYLYGPVLGTILSTIGLTIGSFIAFSLSRYFGRPFVERFVDKVVMDRFDYLLHHKGAFLIFLLFLIPGVPKDYLCYILGLGHLSTVEFLIIGGTGRLFGTILLNIGGDFLRTQQYMKFSMLFGVAIIVVIIALIYKDKIERLLRTIHVLQYKRNKQKRKFNISK